MYKNIKRNNLNKLLRLNQPYINFLKKTNPTHKDDYNYLIFYSEGIYEFGFNEQLNNYIYGLNPNLKNNKRENKNGLYKTVNDTLIIEYFMDCMQGNYFQMFKINSDSTLLYLGYSKEKTNFIFQNSEPKYNNYINEDYENTKEYKLLKIKDKNIKFKLDTTKIKFGNI